MAGKLNKKFKYIWTVLLFLAAVAEFVALRNKETGDTFSEYVRNKIETHLPSEERTTLGWMLRGGLLVTLLWLVPHFFTGAI